MISTGEWKAQDLGDQRHEKRCL